MSYLAKTLARQGLEERASSVLDRFFAPTNQSRVMKTVAKSRTNIDGRLSWLQQLRWESIIPPTEGIEAWSSRGHLIGNVA